MEALLKRIVEQNDQLIKLGSQTVEKLEQLHTTVSDGLREVESQMLTNDSSSDVSSIEFTANNIESTLKRVLEELQNSKSGG